MLYRLGYTYISLTRQRSPLHIHDYTYQALNVQYLVLLLTETSYSRFYAILNNRIFYKHSVLMVNEHGAGPHTVVSGL